MPAPRILLVRLFATSWNRLAVVRVPVDVARPRPVYGGQGEVKLNEKQGNPP